MSRTWARRRMRRVAPKRKKSLRLTPASHALAYCLHTAEISRIDEREQSRHHRIRILFALGKEEDRKCIHEKLAISKRPDFAIAS